MLDMFTTITENRRKETIYVDKDELNQIYLYTFDNKGNEIERIDFDVQRAEPSESIKIPL